MKTLLWGILLALMGMSVVEGLDLVGSTSNGAAAHPVGRDRGDSTASAGIRSLHETEMESSSSSDLVSSNNGDAQPELSDYSEDFSDTDYETEELNVQCNKPGTSYTVEAERNEPAANDLNPQAPQSLNSLSIFEALARGDFNQTSSLLNQLLPLDDRSIGDILEGADRFARNNGLLHVVYMLAHMTAELDERFKDIPVRAATNGDEALLDPIAAVVNEDFKRALNSQTSNFFPINQVAIKDLDSKGCLSNELAKLVSYENPHAMWVIAWHHYRNAGSPSNYVTEAMGKLEMWIRDGQIDDKSKRQLLSCIYYLLGRASHTDREGVPEDNEAAYLFHVRGIETGGEGDVFANNLHRLARQQLNGWGCPKNRELANDTQKIYEEKCRNLGIESEGLEIPLFGALRRAFSVTTNTSLEEYRKTYEEKCKEFGIDPKILEKKEFDFLRGNSLPMGEDGEGSSSSALNDLQGDIDREVDEMHRKLSENTALRYGAIQKGFRKLHSRSPHKMRASDFTL